MKKFSVSKRSYCPHCHTVFQESNDELIPMFPKNIPENIIEDYNEAVVSLSTPKASAAFARRCLKNLLKEISNCEVATLSASAKEAKKHLPQDISESLENVISLGKIKENPLKDDAEGQIVDVEPNEPESILDSIEIIAKNFYL